MPSLLARTVSLLALSVCSAAAQIPQGWIAVSFKQLSAPGSPSGGIYTCSPESPATGVWITGLGTDLTGFYPGKENGAAAVLVRPSDGALVVGEFAPGNGESTDIHVITLNGFAVLSDTLHHIGATDGIGSIGSVYDLHELPDGKVLFFYTQITGGPLAGTGIATLDPATGVIADIPATGMIGVPRAATVDPAGTTAYIATHNFANNRGYVYSVPLPGGGATTFETLFINKRINRLGYTVDGQIAVGFDLTASPGLIKFDPATTIQTTLSHTTTDIDALHVDPITGAIYFEGADTSATICGLHRVDALNSVESLLTCTMMTGWGSISGVSANPSMKRYGAATSGGATADFVLAPNPGGAPVNGNAGFSVTITHSTGADAGLFAIAALPGNDSIYGFVNNLDLLTALAILPLPAATSTTVPLGLPLDPAIIGLPAYSQAAFFGAGGWTATPGLKVTLL